MSVSSVCPQCFKTDGYMNVSRTHYGVCDAHLVKWCIGANVFSSLRDETEADWERNARRLEQYTEVEAALEPFIEAGMELRVLLARLQPLDARNGLNNVTDDETALPEINTLARRLTQLLRATGSGEIVAVETAGVVPF